METCVSGKSLRNPHVPWARKCSEREFFVIVVVNAFEVAILFISDSPSNFFSYICSAVMSFDVRPLSDSPSYIPDIRRPR